VDGATAPPDGVVRPHLIGLPIYKMTGSGNDFVMVDGRISPPEEWNATDIQAACARGTGVGADGIVFLLPGTASGSVRMIYFNSDGSRAAMCGNAALCSTRLAVRFGLAPATGLHLETDAGTYESKLATGQDRAELRFGAASPPTDAPQIALGPGERRLGLAVVGVPHLLVVVDDVETIDLPGRGGALRAHQSLGQEGANVNFLSPGGPEGSWRMRTYERGVEGETLACGTGSVAAGCALDHWGISKLPTVFHTRSGRDLEVRATRRPSGDYDDVWLIGEARLVYRGVLS
jgi:diaminopimelate epimerase